MSRDIDENYLGSLAKRNFLAVLGKVFVPRHVLNGNGQQTATGTANVVTCVRLG